MSDRWLQFVMSESPYTGKRLDIHTALARLADSEGYVRSDIREIALQAEVDLNYTLATLRLMRMQYYLGVEDPQVDGKHFRLQTARLMAIGVGEDAAREMCDRRSDPTSGAEEAITEMLGQKAAV